MCEVPFEVAVAVCIRSIDPVSVDAEQLRQKQCSAAPPDDSTDQARGTDHEKRLAQSVACRRDAIGASSAPDERSRHSSEDFARSRSDCLGDLGWPSLWSAGGGWLGSFPIVAGPILFILSFENGTEFGAAATIQRSSPSCRR